MELLLAHRVREQRFHPELGALQRDRARLEAGEIEQLLDQPTEPLDLREHGLEGLGIGRGHAVDEVLEHDLERGDGRAELVGHVGHEVAPHPVGLGQLRGHLVERPGQFADLVA